MYFVTIFFIAIIVSYSGVALTQRISHKYNILLYPQEDRWHSKPVAVHGGVGFFPIFIILLMLTSAMFSPFNDALKGDIGESEVSKIFDNLTFIIALIGSSSILFIFGWLDDIFKFRALIRLLVQILISFFFIIDIGTFQVSEINTINFLYTLLWFIGITNATNLMDCMDGLCSGTLSIICVFLLLFFLTNNSNSDLGHLFFFSNLVVLFLGTLIGFLILNFPPARIFMGDSGSLPLGFIIAAITLPSEFNAIAEFDNYVIPVLAPISLLIYPIFDTTLVTVTRILDNKKFYVGGKDHSCHRLTKLGFSERHSILICYFISFLGGITALLILLFSDLGLIIFFALLILLLIFGFILGKVKTGN